jgi:hypothetical protein
MTAFAAFVKGKQHEVRQRHQALQEIRGSRGICGSTDLSWRCFSTCPQSRHPERSAAQNSRMRTAYGAESKDPGCAYQQMLFGAFQPQATSQIKNPQLRAKLRIYGPVLETPVFSQTKESSAK